MRVIRRRLSSRGVPDCTDANATWLSERPSHCSPSGAHGVHSLRRFAPANGWTRRVSSAAKRVARATCISLGISAGPGPRVVCGVHPSRFIFVGMIDRLLDDRPRMKRRRLLGLDPVCDPHRRHLTPKTDPALGFASCRVMGTNECIRSGSTPIKSSASGDPRPPRDRFLLSAHGLRANLLKPM
jgi:hypothetical protein